MSFFYTTCLLLRLSHVYIYLLVDTSLSGTLMYYSTDGLIWIWVLQSYVAWIIYSDKLVHACLSGDSLWVTWPCSDPHFPHITLIPLHPSLNPHIRPVNNVLTNGMTPLSSSLVMYWNSDCLNQLLHSCPYRLLLNYLVSTNMISSLDNWRVDNVRARTIWLKT